MEKRTPEDYGLFFRYNHREAPALIAYLKAEVRAGRIPGPTAINAFMGWNGGHQIQRSWASALRIKVFRDEGLVFDDPTQRWAFPHG